MTYFLMLLFVFITLFAGSERWLSKGGFKPEECAILALIWAALGMFFFHNVW